PHAGEVEDVGPAQGIQEASQGTPNVTAYVAENRQLLFDPGGGLVDDAVIVERLGNECASRQQLDQAAQQVSRTAIRGTHVDGVEAQDNGQQPEAGNVVGPIGEFIQGILDAPPLHRWRGGGRRDLRAALYGVTLLDRMGQFVGEKVFAFAGARLI